MSWLRELKSNVSDSDKIWRRQLIDRLDDSYPTLHGNGQRSPTDARRGPPPLPHQLPNRIDVSHTVDGETGSFVPDLPGVKPTDRHLDGTDSSTRRQLIALSRDQARKCEAAARRTKALGASILVCSIGIISIGWISYPAKHASNSHDKKPTDTPTRSFGWGQLETEPYRRVARNFSVSFLKLAASGPLPEVPPPPGKIEPVQAAQPLSRQHIAAPSKATFRFELDLDVETTTGDSRLPIHLDTSSAELGTLLFVLKGLPKDVALKSGRLQADGSWVVSGSNLPAALSIGMSAPPQFDMRVAVSDQSGNVEGEAVIDVRLKRKAIPEPQNELIKATGGQIKSSVPKAAPRPSTGHLAISNDEAGNGTTPSKPRRVLLSSQKRMELGAREPSTSSDRPKSVKPPAPSQFFLDNPGKKWWGLDDQEISPFNNQ